MSIFRCFVALCVICLFNGFAIQKQILWGDKWEEIAKFICQIKGIDPGYMDATWTNTQAHSEKEQSETAINKMGVGVSRKQLQRELGYTQEQINKMAKEKAEEDAAAAARAQTAFNKP